MTSPRVSIGMPVYNGQTYLRKAIESILDQTYPDFELLIADNCSQDDTVAIAEQYASSDRRIRIIRRESNQGAVDNFNFVFRQTSGEYFKWAAADDWCAPTFLEKCVAALDSDPEAAWCHCDSDKIDAEDRSLIPQIPPTDPLLERHGEQLRWRGFPRPDSDHPSAAVRFHRVLLGTTWCVDAYGLFRRTALDQTRLFIDLYGAEKVLIGELSLIGKYAHVPELLFAQRIHDTASSSLESHEAQQEYAGIKRKGFFRTRLDLFAAHRRSIFRHRLSAWDRIRCGWALTSYLLQFGKWWKLLGDLRHRRGLGGGGRRLLDKTRSAGQKKSERRD